MANKPRLGVDFDDVLIDFTNTFRIHHNELHGTTLEYGHLVDWNLGNVFGCSEEEMRRRVYDFVFSHHHIQVAPIEGAADAMRTLSDYYDLFVITARDDIMRNPVDELVAKHFAQLFQELHFANHYVLGDTKTPIPKVEICKRLNVAALIDDSPGTARTTATAGIPVYLPDRPWNQGEMPPLVTRVANWEEILERLTPQI